MRRETTDASACDHTAPIHVESVRRPVFDALSPTQVEQLDQICGVLLRRLDPDGRFAASLL